LIQALLVDLDQTLADDRFSAAEAWEQAFAALSAIDSTIPHDDLEDVYWRLSNDIWAVLDENMRPDATAAGIRLEVWRESLRRMGCLQWEKLGRLASDRYWEHRLETYHLYPDVIPFLQAAREVVPVILVTNGTCDIQEAKIEKTGLNRYVDTALIAQAVGASKPSAVIFRKALEAANCGPENALMVGDNYSRDIFGALRCGMRAVWVQRDVQYPEPPFPPYPELTVRTLLPVLDLLPAGVT